MQLVFTLGHATLVLLGLAAIQFLVALWLKARLESSIKAEYDRVLEDYRFELRAREQAAKAAEYISLARSLTPDSPATEYRRANQLAWELALWLPDDLYRKLGRAMTSQANELSFLLVLIEIRRHLLKAPGSLTDNDILHHAPNIGAIRSIAHPTKP